MTMKNQISITVRKTTTFVQTLKKVTMIMNHPPLYNLQIYRVTYVLPSLWVMAITWVIHNTTAIPKYIVVHKMNTHKPSILCDVCVDSRPRGSADRTAKVTNKSASFPRGHMNVCNKCYEAFTEMICIFHALCNSRVVVNITSGFL